MRDLSPSRHFLATLLAGSSLCVLAALPACSSSSSPDAGGEPDAARDSATHQPDGGAHDGTPTKGDGAVDAGLDALVCPRFDAGTGAADACQPVVDASCGTWVGIPASCFAGHLTDGGLLPPAICTAVCPTTVGQLGSICRMVSVPPGCQPVEVECEPGDCMP